MTEQLVKSTTMKASVQFITPEIAKDYLKRNIQNRAVKKDSVSHLTRLMTAGKWVENGESIIFDKNGALKDGQHRLEACVKSGHSFHAVIVKGVDPDVMTTIDTGINRLLSDILFLNGFHTSTGIASITKSIIIYNRRQLQGNQGAKKVTNQVGFKYALKHQKVLYEYYKIGQRFNNGINRVHSTSWLATALHITCKGKMPTDDHIEFLKRLVGKSRVEGTGSAWFFALCEKAVRDKIRLHDFWKCGMLIKVWNVYVQGDAAVRYLKFEVDEGLPEVL